MNTAPKWYDDELRRLYLALEARLDQTHPEDDDYHTIYKMMETVEGLDCDLEAIGGTDV